MLDKSKIKGLIASGEADAALALLLKYAQDKGLGKLENALLMLQARSEQVRREAQQGLITQEQAHTFQNQVNAGLLHLVAHDPDQELHLPELLLPPQPKTTKRNWWPPLILAGLLLVYIIANHSRAQTFSLTVFVHGTQGPEQRLLRNEGIVVLHIGQDQREALINEKGEADFKEIPAKFKGKKARIVIDHPQPYQSTHPDSLYLLLPGQPIYLETSLRNTDKVFGRVFDFDSGDPLAGVVVSIRNATTTSDENGYFELHIPEPLQSKFQNIAFQKSGYEFSKLDSVPVHTRQEVQMALHRKH